HDRGAQADAGGYDDDRPAAGVDPTGGRGGRACRPGKSGRVTVRVSSRKSLLNNIQGLSLGKPLLRRASSRPRVTRHAEHVPDKASEATHDRGVILLPIAREPT